MPVRFRISLLLPLLASLLLAACAPQALTVANSVLPQIFSVRSDGGTVTVQGRYLGTGQGGYEAGNYVLIGADSAGIGGRAYTPTSWTNTHLELTVTPDENSGLIFVVVDGQFSNALTLNRN